MEEETEKEKARRREHESLGQEKEGWMNVVGSAKKKNPERLI